MYNSQTFCIKTDYSFDSLGYPGPTPFNLKRFCISKYKIVFDSRGLKQDIQKSDFWLLVPHN